MGGYSNGGGGALTLPSHVDHVDVTSAVRSLRRSLSRSPSKSFRLVTKSPSSSPKSPLSPCPLSPSRRSLSQSATNFSGAANNPPHTPSPLAVPFPPSAKLALRSSSRSKAASSRPSSRTRTSPKSPVKRALSQAPDSGNAPPISSASSSSGQENSRSTSPADHRNLERAPRMPFNPDNINAPVNPALSRLGGDSTSDCQMASSTSSPLKRSDAIMNLDQASLGSPVAKRRSLHGSASFGHDFNVFDHGPPAPPQHFEIHDDSSHEYELSATSFALENPATSFSSMPRRSSSLRKSTLQQRHGEKTSWGRRHAAQVLAAQQSASIAPEVATPNPTKNRPRLSLDQFLPPMARESPFSSQGNLPSSSMHMMNQPTHQPHPLSRTMTTSSSSSSIVDESPTHVPAHFGEQPRPKLDFSKSLPAGSSRPFNVEEALSESSGSFSTPQNYKSAKPLPAAFMSTGLISKFNRHPEEQQVPCGTSKGIVPDTPCKKHVNVFATYPSLVPGSAVARARHIRHSFGTPSTPFNPHSGQTSISSLARGAGVFGSAFGNSGLARRGSFLSADGDENGGSPEAKMDSQSCVDMELPPTPTKQALVSDVPQVQQGNGSPSSHRSLPASTSSRIDFLRRLTPHTPRETMPPSDPTSLSISNLIDGSAVKTGTNSATMPPPATPTTGRDYFSKIGDRHLSTTPVSSFAPSERDESLSSRFEKFELIGTGEFSRVYRVKQTTLPPSAAKSFYFSSSTSQARGRSPPTPMMEPVFAVKKSRLPYQGPKDRLRKLQEVSVLKALGRSDHVIHLIDSWEEKNHLYIQTEYCEEGSLDLFLSDVGRKGRLDDFRIWKIMLELSQVYIRGLPRGSTTNKFLGSCAHS
jgi:mitosis inhibitor protein kinase SWE1